MSGLKGYTDTGLVDLTTAELGAYWDASGASQASDRVLSMEVKLGGINPGDYDVDGDEGEALVAVLSSITGVEESKFLDQACDMCEVADASRQRRQLGGLRSSFVQSRRLQESFVVVITIDLSQSSEGTTSTTGPAEVIDDDTLSEGAVIGIGVGGAVVVIVIVVVIVVVVMKQRSDPFNAAQKPKGKDRPSTYLQTVSDIERDGVEINSGSPKRMKSPRRSRNGKKKKKIERADSAVEMTEVSPTVQGEKIKKKKSRSSDGGKSPKKAKSPRRSAKSPRYRRK